MTFVLLWIIKVQILIFLIIHNKIIPTFILIYNCDLYQLWSGCRNRNRNKFFNQIRAPGGHIQLTNMPDTQQQYIKLNIHGEVSIIGI